MNKSWKQLSENGSLQDFSDKSKVRIDSKVDKNIQKNQLKSDVKMQMDTLKNEILSKKENANNSLENRNTVRNDELNTIEESLDKAYLSQSKEVISMRDSQYINNKKVNWVVLDAIEQNAIQSQDRSPEVIKEFEHVYTDVKSDVNNLWNTLKNFWSGT